MARRPKRWCRDQPLRQDVVQFPLLGRSGLKQPGIAHEGVFQKVEVGFDIVADLPGQHQLLLVELVFQDDFDFMIELLPGVIEEKGNSHGAGQDHGNDQWQGHRALHPAWSHLA